MFLGIDLGTSSVKVLLADRQGSVLAEADAGYSHYGAEEGYFEQEPSDWTESILRAAASLRAEIPENLWGRIEAVGLSAQMPTMVLTDRGGTTLGRAIVWCDGRADEQGKRLLKLWGEERHYCKTGVKLDGRYIIPMYQWVRENKPGLLSAPHCILSAKDYIYNWMCGEAATDPSTASGYAVYNINTGIWDEELCAEAAIPMESLPEIMDSQVGRPKLKRELCEAFGLDGGVAVCVGAADSAAGVLGLGAVEPGTVCQICGSSTAIIAVCDTLKIDEKDSYFVTPLAKKGSFGLEADILSTGKTSGWVADLFEKGLYELSGIAQKAAPGSEGVVFSPYLSGGEQGVLWDPGLAGGILGLSFHHTISHIVRAHYEGICFESKRCIDAFKSGGYAVTKVLMTGPVSADPFFMQLTSDILELECIASEKENASAYGAAILAGIGSGAFDWSFTAENKSGRVSYKPDPDTAKQYRAFYERYLEASAATRFRYAYQLDR